MAFSTRKHKCTRDEIVQKIVESGAITLRDVDNGEKAFVFSSGNRGPCYIMIKDLVGQPHVFNFLVTQLANKIKSMEIKIDFINGNVTGGVPCGFALSQKLTRGLVQTPFVYLRGSRKKGGHNELITGIRGGNNPRIKSGDTALIVEELVNYGETTINAAEIFRERGYTVTHAATILSYDHEGTRRRLKENNLTLISLITLPELLMRAKKLKLFSDSAIESCQKYLEDPVGWQLKRGMVIPENSVKDAKGKNMISMNESQALWMGAPQIKTDTMKYYYSREKMLYIAMDFPAEVLLDKIKEIGGYVSLCRGNGVDIGFKINLDAVISDSVNFYTDVLGLIDEYQIPVFVDLKMWNGLRTMSSIVKTLVKYKVSVINVYGHIGKKYLTDLAKITKGTDTELFVLTVLTHYDEDYVKELYGKSISGIIRTISKWASDAGADGLILPSTYLNVVKDCPLLKMCPGIRPDYYYSSNNLVSSKQGFEDYFKDQNANNQVQISTPTKALKAGANYLVIGRPITRSKDMEAALKRIVMEMNLSIDSKM